MFYNNRYDVMFSCWIEIGGERTANLNMNCFVIVPRLLKFVAPLLLFLKIPSDDHLISGF